METALFAFYNAVFSPTWPLLHLYYLLHRKTSGKYRENFRQRLGIGLPDFHRFPEAPVWIHALSVGEFLSVTPLIDALKSHHPDVPVVVSAATEKGYRVAQNHLGRDGTLFFLPHDHLWTMRRLVHRVNPRLFILVETDLWPNLIRELHRNGTPIVLVNARLSPRSFRRLLRLRPLVRPMLRRLDFLFAQSERDAVRFRRLGLSPRKVLTAGNLKFDYALKTKNRSIPESFLRVLSRLEGRQLWIAGSTHKGEDEVVLEAHRAVLLHCRHAVLILAPRQIERAEGILSQARHKGFRAQLRSTETWRDEDQVLILDSMGELAFCYLRASGAFIGGSLVPSGGHNPLEAAVHKVPCCWGPHLFNFREVEALLEEWGCGHMIRNSSELARFIVPLLQGHGGGTTLRKRCEDVVRRNAGASERIVRILSRLLE